MGIVTGRGDCSDLESDGENDRFPCERSSLVFLEPEQGVTLSAVGTRCQASAGVISVFVATSSTLFCFLVYSIQCCTARSKS